jgi:hypothetical protein
MEVHVVLRKLFFLWTLTVLPVTPLLAQEIFSDGFESGDAGRWHDVVGWEVLDALRFSDSDLRDPHVFVDTGFPLGCRDVTDEGVGGVVPSVNEEVETSMTTDGDDDGDLDSSTLLIFRPFNAGITDGSVVLTKADCTAPAENTQCRHSPEASPRYLRYDGLPAGPCLEVIPGTTSGYTPVITEPGSECFSTHEAVIWVDLNGTPVPLHNARIGAQETGGTIDHTEPGILMGFLFESDADTTLLPDDTPLIGGQPLSSVLPGGTDCCAPGDDRDTLDGVSGWWMYFNWVGDSVPFTP